MARAVQTVITSDLSGKDVAEKDLVTITLTYADPRKNKIELDASVSEVAQWAKKGREVKRRGRRPGSKNKPKA